MRRVALSDGHRKAIYGRARADVSRRLVAQFKVSSDRRNRTSGFDQIGHLLPELRWVPSWHGSPSWLSMTIHEDPTPLFPGHITLD